MIPFGWSIACIKMCKEVAMNCYKKSTQLMMFVTLSLAYNMHAADLIVFSYDRPLQLYAFLESAYTYLTGLTSIHVIYRTSASAFDDGYAQVKEAFSDVHFVQQSPESVDDFKSLLLLSLADSPSEYVIFSVDDILLTDYVDIAFCTQKLAQTGAYGFFLRLGKNITAHAMGNKIQQLPLFNDVQDDVLTWRFDQGGISWGYAHTVDMTLYKKSTIIVDLASLIYTSPNSLEHAWSQRVDYTKHGLCFEKSKIINIPLNRVQNEFNTMYMDYSTQELLDLFNKGFRLDVESLYHFEHNAPHVFYEPTFICCV